MTIPKEIQDLIDGSGNTFHAKVSRWFLSQGWEIQVSPYYMDQSQQKARELDLIVEKAWPLVDSFGKWKGQVVVRLFVECKFVPGHSVFWFADKNRAATEAVVCEVLPFRLNNTYTAKHHYLADCPRVAKLFVSNGRGQEAEPFYKALNQALNAMVSMRDRLPQVTHKSFGKGSEMIVLNYPVVVCNSFKNIYAADFSGTAAPSQITENFQMEVQYAFVDPENEQREELFLLDFVEFDKLSVFQAAISTDADTAVYLG